MTIKHYHFNIVDGKNRINELIEECTYSISGVPHIDFNELALQLVLETIDKMEEAQDSGFSPDKYVLEHFGIKL